VDAPPFAAERADPVSLLASRCEVVEPYVAEWQDLGDLGEVGAVGVYGAFGDALGEGGACGLGEHGAQQAPPVTPGYHGFAVSTARSPTFKQNVWLRIGSFTVATVVT
jgi:hypothetical protein